MQRFLIRGSLDQQDMKRDFKDLVFVLQWSAVVVLALFAWKVLQGTVARPYGSVGWLGFSVIVPLLYLMARLLRLNRKSR